MYDDDLHESDSFVESPVRPADKIYYATTDLSRCLVTAKTSRQQSPVIAEVNRDILTLDDRSLCSSPSEEWLLF